MIVCLCVSARAYLMVVCGPTRACVRAQVMSFGAEVQRKTAEASWSLPGGGRDWTSPATGAQTRGEWLFLSPGASVVYPPEGGCC